MEWPSNRISPGGIFHPKKVSYSPETHSLLKVLMDESKMTMFQRKKMDYFLRSGTSLPTLDRNNKINVPSQQPKIIVKPGLPRRRSQSAIMNSGAYKRDQFVPIHPIINRNDDIEKLQNLMAYGKTTVDKPKKKTSDKNKKAYKVAPKPNRFDQLKQEVNERIEWLNEMENLGEAEPHRQTIEQQIAGLLREIERLKPSESSENKN